MATSRPSVTAVVCAYNEAANMGGLSRTLLTRDADTFDELIVVSSGSTDGTDDIVRQFQESAPKLRLISETERTGKAHAVNLALDEARGDIIILIDADAVPAPGTLLRLIGACAEPGNGGAGSRNVVTNPAESWVARASTVLWELHHLVNLQTPVLGGDIVAFRRVAGLIPEGTINDDYAIEAALRARDIASPTPRRHECSCALR